jgi:hypothetical protein
MPVDGFVQIPMAGAAAGHDNEGAIAKEDIVARPPVEPAPDRIDPQAPPEAPALPEAEPAPTPGGPEIVSPWPQEAPPEQPPQEAPSPDE